MSDTEEWSGAVVTQRDQVHGKPLGEFIEEQRAKHNQPADWPHAPRYRMTDDDWRILNSAALSVSESVTEDDPAK